ncbi:hypothetical protein LCGC14_1239180, partial [marine sediment metagenome]
KIRIKTLKLRFPEIMLVILDVGVVCGEEKSDDNQGDRQ